MGVSYHSRYAAPQISPAPKPERTILCPFWSDRWASLTDREREVVKLVAKGLMSRQIAIELDISQRTVEVHRASGLKKLQIQTPAQAALVLSEIEDQNRTL